VLVISVESIEPDDLWRCNWRVRSANIDREIGIGICECARNERAEQEKRVHCERDEVPVGGRSALNTCLSREGPPEEVGSYGTFRPIVNASHSRALE